MPTYLAFLRGINVGGNSLLPMKQLIEICQKAGCTDVRTYINSGNCILSSPLKEAGLKKKLEETLQKERGRVTEVMIRTPRELEHMLKHNPFQGANPSYVGVVLLDKPAPGNYLKGFDNPGPEEIKLGKREIYIHYPDGMGRSKLKLPPLDESGTVRNINTLTKLAALVNIKNAG